MEEEKEVRERVITEWKGEEGGTPQSPASCRARPHHKRVAPSPPSSLNWCTPISRAKRYTSAIAYHGKIQNFIRYENMRNDSLVYTLVSWGQR